MDTKLNDGAALAARDAAKAHLTEGAGVQASAVQVACALAKAYGSVLAEVHLASNSAALVDGVNALTNEAYQEVLDRALKPSAQGRCNGAA